jgi:hypothetical protein
VVSGEWWVVVVPSASASASANAVFWEENGLLGHECRWTSSSQKRGWSERARGARGARCARSTRSKREDTIRSSKGEGGVQVQDGDAEAPR